MNLNKALAASSVLCAFVLSTSAHAGAAYAPPVVVFDDGSGATGSLVGARNSEDATQHIMCDYMANVGSNEFVATCDARSAAGATFSCSSTDPRIIAAVQSISESSFISAAADKNGKCRYVYVSNSSRFLP